MQCINTNEMDCSLFVVLENQFLVFGVDSLEQVLSVPTSMNPKGVFATTGECKRTWIAYPDEHLTGKVKMMHIQESDSSNEEVIINAHRSTISCLEFNSPGTMLATASSHGTQVHIWSVPSAVKLHTLRRGNSPCRITGMCFGPSRLFAIASSHKTIHIFKLDHNHQGLRSPKKAFFLESKLKILKIPLPPGNQSHGGTAVNFPAKGGGQRGLTKTASPSRVPPL